MKKLNLLFTLLMMLAMVGLAELLGEKEIIFPEIIALAIGAWLAPKQPWHVNKRKLFCLMSLSSVVGILITCYIPGPLFLKIALAFSFTAVSLIISKTTLVPMISACILPILLGTTSWIYPLSVVIMSGIIVGVQSLLERWHLREAHTYVPTEIHLKEEGFIWFKRLLLFMLIAAFPCYSKLYYFIAPPLIVSFVELTHEESPVRKSPHKVILLITLVAIIGTVFRLIFNEQLGFSLTLCATLVTILVILIMKKLTFFFPPAGAIAILPMILDPTTLNLYPLQILIGISVFTALALIAFPSKREGSISEKEFTLSE